MFRQRRPDHPPAAPSSTPICELSVSAFNALSRETSRASHCSPGAQTESIYRPLFSITSKRLIPQPLSFDTLTNAYRCFLQQPKVAPQFRHLAPSIPFRITSFADSCPITSTESHLYKIARGGAPVELPPLSLCQKSSRNIQVLPLAFRFWECTSERTTGIEGVTRV